VETLMQVSSIAVQIILTAAALWYAWETRALRLQSETEAELLKEQVRLSATPFVLPFLRIANRAKLSVRYSCTVRNPTPQPALQVTPFVFVPQEGKFLRFQLTADWEALTFGKDEGKAAETFDQFMARDEVTEFVSKKLGADSAAFLSPHLSTDSFYVLIIFKNVLGRSHIVKRFLTSTSEHPVINDRLEVFVEA